MKIQNVVFKSLSGLAFAGLVTLASCNKSTDSPLSSTDSQNVNSESVSDSYASESSDLGNSVVSNVTSTQLATGRTEGKITGLEAKDPRLAGATITITPTGTKDAPAGTITIDFGTGVTTNGVTRVGQIILTYSGKKGVAGSTRTVGYNGYSRNDVKFDNNMKFTITNVTDSTVFHHVLTGGALTFPDNTTILRISDYYVTLDYSAKTLTLSATPNYTGHSASGTTRAGKSYTMDITKPLVYKSECAAAKVFIAASGTKSITAGLLTYTIDYGDGVCDNTVTITVGGKTVTITASSNGN
ncbi:MAG: hypothetical protein JSS79_17730 [Bacteroidetes bacterium]|nr:hypothetical protein [Bacteroidota bacterium]